MSSIKYYVLRTGEEPPMEFVAIRHVDGEPEFVASYVNSSYLSYENGVLLKMHERNDTLRAENAKLRELCADLRFCKRNNCLTCSHGRFCDMRFDERYAELGVEVD